MQCLGSESQNVAVSRGDCIPTAAWSRHLGIHEDEAKLFQDSSKVGLLPGKQQTARADSPVWRPEAEQT